MSHTTESVANADARCVLDSCRDADRESRIVYVGSDFAGRTVVRVRGGSRSSTAALKQAIHNRLPVAKVQTSENPLDGILHVEAVVPLPYDEQQIALTVARENKGLRILHCAASVFIFLGLFLWAFED